jgi:hypothetical protein
MQKERESLERLIQKSSQALVIGVGGGADVVGSLATRRFLEFARLKVVLGGLPWEQPSIDPEPGPRTLDDISNVRVLHERVWLANAETKMRSGVRFAESRMAEILGEEVLLVDINGGVQGIVAGLERAMEVLGADLLVGVDAGGDSLASGAEAGLRSPLADAMLLAAFTAMEDSGRAVIWSVFGYGSDGELSPDEIESALAHVAREGGLLGAWGLTPQIVDELEMVIARVPTEASALPVRCARGATGMTLVRNSLVRQTPIASLTFYLDPKLVYETVSKPAQAVATSTSLDEANAALNAIGITTELDLERSAAASLRARGSDGTL